MASIGLSAYSIKIRRRRDQELIELASFTQNLDFLDVLQMYLEHAEDRLHDLNRSQKAYLVGEPNINDRSIKGTISSGEYGFESELYHMATGNHTHQRAVDEAELRPFYYISYIPHEGDMGILLTQSIGISGITGVMRHAVESHFNRSFPNFELLLRPLIPTEYIQQYLEEGRIARLELIKFNLPNDIATAILEPNSQENFELEISVKAKRGNSITGLRHRLLETLRGDRIIADVVELADVDIQNVKAIVEVGNKEKTINFQNISRLKPTYDITPLVEIGANGLPTLHSVDVAATDLLGTLRDQLEI